MATVQRLPDRSEVKLEDTWDLGSLSKSDADWKKNFAKFEEKISEYAKFQGTLADSAESLAKCLEFDSELELLGEQVGTYAFLRSTEDVANSTAQEMVGMVRNVSSRAAQASSFIRPEIMSIPDEKMQAYLSDPVLEKFKLGLERVLRYKKHTLNENEERLLAMQSEMASTAGQAFRQLNDADMNFGVLELSDGEQLELSHATFSKCLHLPDREVRKKAFHQYYEQYQGHCNTIATTLNGSVQADIYYAKARNYDSAIASALFPDNVPMSVYDNLISSVHDHLPSVHKYLEVRRKAMKIDEIHHYDTYVPILSDLSVDYPWEEAVETILTSLQPLGNEYGEVLKEGLLGRWCDRYENKGKQSGAFSCGTFTGDPYILMNYQSDVLDHVFTLTHEAGHSMHSF